VNTCADKLQRADRLGFEIPTQREQLCIRASASVTPDNNAARIGNDINEKVTLIWGQTSGALAQIQAIEAQPREPTDFEATDTQNQSWRELLPKQLQTIRLAFRTTSKNKDCVRRLWRICPR
jgi:hypothetical protein